MKLLAIIFAMVLTGCAAPNYPYPCNYPYATAWRFDVDVGRFCRTVCDPAPGVAQSDDFDVRATQLPIYECWPIVRE